MRTHTLAVFLAQVAEILAQGGIKLVALRCAGYGACGHGYGPCGAPRPFLSVFVPCAKLPSPPLSPWTRSPLHAIGGTSQVPDGATDRLAPQRDTPATVSTPLGPNVPSASVFFRRNILLLSNKY